MRLKELRIEFEKLRPDYGTLFAIDKLMSIHYGYDYGGPIEKLLTYANHKTSKGEKHGYYTGILYLASHTSSGLDATVCPSAVEANCFGPCLTTAGRGKYQKTQLSRIRKTLLYFLDREYFIQMLITDIHKGARSAKKKGMEFAVRLDGTSDIPWERTAVMGAVRASGAIAYDYTKIISRILAAPKEYHLILSYSGSRGAYRTAVEKFAYENPTINIAVVFRKEMPEIFLGRRVINGDETDLRFLDEVGVVVGLKAKGKAIYDYGGFVVDFEDFAVGALAA